MSVDADGPAFTDPRGRRVEESPLPPSLAALGWDAVLVDNQSLDITAATNEGEWDGEPPDYSEIVHELLARDERSAAHK